MTPRKTQARHRNQPSQPHALQQVQPSDYESEAAPYNPDLIPTRTNTELNLSVLRRYVPNVTDIPSLATSVDVYTYSPSAQAWERAEITGTMFICDLNHGNGYCLVILNKKGMDNLIIDMKDVLDLELTSEFLIVRFVDKGKEKALGFFIQDVPVGTRETICLLIKGSWEKVGADGSAVQGRVEVFEDPVDMYEESLAPAPVPGQKLNLSELFGQQGGVR